MEIFRRFYSRLKLFFDHMYKIRHKLKIFIISRCQWTPQTYDEKNVVLSGGSYKFSEVFQE